MYTQSPQLPRKTYDFNPSQSPYMQHKFPANESTEFIGHYSPYKPLPQHQQQQQPSSTFSPVIRKRYQEGNLISEDLEFRILHGNTSPIVLQRFYHQQNQLKDQKEEDQLRLRMQSASPNPFKHTQSSIPIKSGSPVPNLRFQQQQYHQQQQHQFHRNILHESPPTNFNASQRIYESQIPRMMQNGGIPYRQQQQHHHQPQPHHPHHQPMYDNIAHRPQIACPSSPQLDRLRANLEKPNFYERHQKLPVEIESYQQQLEMAINQNNGGLIGEHNKNKEKGEFMETFKTLNKKTCNRILINFLLNHLCFF